MMHTSMGISVRPLLVTTTTLNSALGRRWATIINPCHCPLGSLCTGNLEGRTRNVERSPTCDLSGSKVVDSASDVNRRAVTWTSCSNPRQTARGGVLGFWILENEGRQNSLVCSSRRGFLSELQSLREKEEAASVEFESPLSIVLYPDPRLRKKNKRVTVFDEKLEQLVKEMFEIMYQTDGVGLAAPQVGVNVQLMLYNPEGEKEQGQEYILVNPKIVKYGKQRDFLTEGCLSFLQLEADVERPFSVRVEAQDIKGKRFGLTLKGWQARIFQHEYDHLEGVLYHDRMIPAEIENIRPGLVQLEEDYQRRTGLPPPERVK